MSGTTNKCGSVDKYCPAGSSAPTDVSEGYYSGPEDADVDVRSESTICPIGYYCTGGVKRPCPAGSYGTSEGLSSSTCTASCEAGYYCPGGDEKLECGSITKYCPAGSSAPSDVPEGYYSGPESAEETKRYQKVICPAGSYCSGGEKTLCPAGHFGETTGLSTADCSGSCPAGYYCPEGSVSGTTNKCGSVDKYCPAGSSAPSSVSEGYYSGPEDADVDVRSESTICPIGYYCTGGVKRPCPAGSYGTSEGLSSSTCTASCEAGYYCPGGDEKLECGSVEKYCPAGSSAPSDVPDGYCSGPLTSPFITRFFIFLPDSRHTCIGGLYADELFVQL